MTDRPRAERRIGMTVIFDQQAGYVRELTLREAAALASELLALIELGIITYDQIPERA